MKQENVMINERGDPMLIDFRYAKFLDVSPMYDENEGNATVNHLQKLTPCMEQQNKYISPEII